MKMLQFILCSFFKDNCKCIKSADFQFIRSLNEFLFETGDKNFNLYKHPQYNNESNDIFTEHFVIIILITRILCDFRSGNC